MTLINHSARYGPMPPFIRLDNEISAELETFLLDPKKVKSEITALTEQNERCIIRTWKKHFIATPTSDSSMSSLLADG